MRIAVIADVHLDRYPNVKGHLEAITDAFATCVTRAKLAGAQVLVVAGDYLNKRQHIDAEVLYHALQCARKTLTFQKIYFLGGNHEYLSDEHNVLQCIPRIASKLSVSYTSKLTLENVTLLPWGPEDRLLRTIQSDTSDYLISHFPVQGCRFNATAINSPTGLPLDELSGYKAVLLGDFHHQQQIGNVHYAGSPLQHDFGETGNTTGFLILDTATGQVEHHAVPSRYPFLTIDVTDRLDDTQILHDAHVWFKCANSEIQAIVKEAIADYRQDMRSCRITVEDTAPRQSGAAKLDLQLGDLDTAMKRYIKARLTQTTDFKKKVYSKYTELRQKNANRVSHFNAD